MIHNSMMVKKLIELALEEDLSLGDCTSAYTVAADCLGTGTVLAKEPMVVCGTPLINRIAEIAGFPIEVSTLVQDGTRVDGTRNVIARLSGTVRDLLSIERTMLNFLQRLSGVATYTRNVVDASCGITILDTRKTMPGWRLLEKYAVRVGGARNHRMSLGDMVLVKNNHIDCSGGIAAMMQRVTTQKPPYMPVEVEVRTLAELKEVLHHGTPDILMLDNMSDAALKEAIAFCKHAVPQCKIEVSGGIFPERFERLKAVGVETVSMGALTTKATNVDLSFSITM